MAHKSARSRTELFVRATMPSHSAMTLTVSKHQPSRVETPPTQRVSTYTTMTMTANRLQQSTRPLNVGCQRKYTLFVHWSRVIRHSLTCGRMQSRYTMTLKLELIVIQNRVISFGELIVPLLLRNLELTTSTVTWPWSKLLHHLNVGHS